MSVNSVRKNAKWKKCMDMLIRQFGNNNSALTIRHYNNSTIRHYDITALQRRNSFRHGLFELMLVQYITLP